MNAAATLLTAHGPMLLAGLTVWLALGCAAVAASRSPIRQLRCVELTAALALLWVVLALLPLPRPWSGWFGRSSAAERDAHAAGAVETPVATVGSIADNPARAVPVPTSRSLPADVQMARADSPPAAVDVPATPPEPRAPQAVAAVNSTVESRSSRSDPPVQSRPALRRGDVRRQRTSMPAPREPVAAQPAAPRSASPEPAPIWPAQMFLAAAGAVAAWLVAGRCALARLRWRAQAPKPWLAEIYAELPWPRHRRRPALWVTPRCDRPFAFGVWRPTILLPAYCCQPARRGQLRHVLLHELGHARQRDAWGQALLNAALPLLCFHPLYWWLRGRAHLCRELVADDWAARQSDRHAYARELIDLIVSRGRVRGASLGLSVFRSPTEFYRRMTMLLEREQALETRCSWAFRVTALSAGALAIVLFAGGLGLRADDETDDDDRAAAERFDDDDEREDDDDYAEEDASDDDDADDEAKADEEGDDDEEAESDDEGEEEASSDDEDDEAEDADDDESEEDDEGDEDDEASNDEDVESMLAELEERRSSLMAELAELEARIQESANYREWRDAEAQRAAHDEEIARQREEQQAEWQAALDEATARIAERLTQEFESRWAAVLEEGQARFESRLADGVDPQVAELRGALEEMSVARQQLEESLGDLASQVEELREDRHALREEVESLRAELAEARQASSDVDDKDGEPSDDDEERVNYEDEDEENDDAPTVPEP
jgi:beta-lactamase regulating signal transducer with metallopeptidase domain